MARATRQPGVDVKQGAYRVRLNFNGRRFVQEGIATLDEANDLAAKWRELRRAGLTPAEKVSVTGADAAEQLLVRKRTEVSRKTQRHLRPSGILWWERALRPLRPGGELAGLPVELIARNRVEDLILARAVDHPKTARDELDGIKAALKLAAARGANIDSGIFSIERPAVTPRKRQAISADELGFLASFAPTYARNLILFAGTVGARIGELFTLTDDRVDLAGASIFIPADLCKEGVDKTIDLFPDEVQLLREQLLARAPGSSLVFPTKTGRPWRHFQFLRLVWYKARARAAAALIDTCGLDPTARARAGVFGTLQPHDLRATAATLMRDHGFAREDAAARLGHADTGELLDRIYDQGDRRARVRAAMLALAPEGLRAAVNG